MSNLPTKEERDSFILDKARDIITLLKDYYPPNCFIIITHNNVKICDSLNIIDYDYKVIDGENILNLL